ncbi:hypothetical protein [Asanoa iriomotensis]|nr:hypothetical protein [Asanoa iriomotensis]
MAIARARRRRLGVWMSAAAVVAVLLGLAVPWGLSRGKAVPTAPSSLPDRVGAPHWGTASVDSSPAGAASVVFGAPSWWLTGSKGVLAVVGASDDSYRLTDELGDLLYAGEQAILSPDGSRLATVGLVTDLNKGTSVALPVPDGVPQAWSPDGRTLAVVAYDAPYARQPDGSEVPTPVQATLHLADLASHTYERVADLDPRGVHDGYTVAFAPDGTKLAYQSAQTITVATVAGETVSQFTTSGHLAGKGAWTPDGMGLTLVSQRRCCDGDSYPARWQLSVVDPANGQARSAPAIPELPGLVAVRLLGWSPAGEAVVAALYPEPDISVVGFDTAAETLSVAHLRFTDYQWVRETKVLAVGPGGASRTLLSAPEQEMLSVDVADNVIAGGQARTGQPPRGLGTRLLGTVVVIVALAVALAVVVRRAGNRLRRAPRGPVI